MTRKWLNIVGVLLSVLLASCGRGVEGQVIDHGPFEKYVQKFSAYSQQYGRVATLQDSQVVIRFGDVGGSKRTGICRHSVLSLNEIILDENKWKHLSESSREALLLHEFGHCVMNREHNDEKERGRPKSLMNSILVDGSTFETYKETYLQELFSAANE